MSQHLINEAKNELRERAYDECFDTIYQLIEELQLKEKTYFNYILEQMTWLKKRYDYFQRRKSKETIVEIKIETALEAFLNLVWYQEEMLKEEERIFKKEVKAILKINEKKNRDVEKTIEGLNILLNINIKDTTKLFTKENIVYIGIKIENGGAVTKLKSIGKLNLIPALIDLQVLNNFLDNFYTAITHLYINLENVDFKRFVHLYGNRDEEQYLFYLSKKDLSWANCAYAKFIDFRMNSINLSHSNMQNTEWESVRIKKANLLGANLQKANFHDVNFSETNLSYANVEETRWVVTSLVKSRCKETNFTKSDFYKVDFASNLFKANFTQSDFYKVDFSESLLEETVFDLKDKSMIYEQAPWHNCTFVKTHKS